MNARNWSTGILTIPASGGAAVLNPGTNLAISSERAPRALKSRWVRRTHESGSSEMRHSQLRTRPPRTRPIQYQMVSLTSEATAARTSTSATLSRPLPATAPAASRTGTAGSGSPICSANTQPNTTT